jgi:hypothetical protein
MLIEQTLWQCAWLVAMNEHARLVTVLKLHACSHPTHSSLVFFFKLTALYKPAAPNKSLETRSFIKVGASHQNACPPSGKAATP